MTPRLLAACLLVSALGGCASAPPVPTGRGPLARYADAIDWDKAGEEVTQVLSAYLQVDTINPPGNELRGVAFLAQALEKEGIASTTYETAPGRGSLVARLPAQGTPTEKPLCLLSHIDVVPAEASEWPEDKQPLSGAIDEDSVWGRGALDTKGLGALELMTMAWLKRTQVPLSRDVLLLAVADEEVDNTGMRDLVEKHWAELDCGTLLNEGGLGLKSVLTPGQTLFAISVAERGTLWLRMTAKGEAGHGSTPVPGRAPERLLEAARLVNALKSEPRIHPAVYELLRRAGAQQGGLKGAVLQSEGLVNAFVTGKLLEKPPTRAIITDTCQVTGFEGVGSAPNVIPSEVSAIVDCRLLPGTKSETLLKKLEELVKPVGNVEFQVLQAKEANASDWNDPLFEALVRHVTYGRTDAVAGPTVSTGFTDSIYARPMGTKAYGFVPFELEGRELATMHGRNERVSKENLRRGLEVLFRAVVDAAARR